MKTTILLPHFKTGKMSAYTIAQLLKYKGKHDIEIFVIDNNAGDESIQYLDPFLDHIKIFSYPKDKMQSHGIAFDWVMPYVKTDYFITIESDSFPTSEEWLDEYEFFIENEVDSAGSIISLSGGTYLHPAGALYKRSVWQEAKQYCNSIEYSYFPNISNKEGFDFHLMVHNRVLNEFLINPEDYIELGNSYKGKTYQEILERAIDYSPTVNPFHNGMGMKQESIKTYGNRDIQSDYSFIMLDNRMPLIHRVGYEPGQWLSYYCFVNNKKVINIPTEIKWLPNRENQQQERTIMSNGFTHLWGVSAYHDSDAKGVDDIKEIKQRLPDILYNSLPENQKIMVRNN